MNIESYQELWQICLQAVFILLILVAIYWRHIISFFDPLFFYLVTQAFSIELGFLVIPQEYLIHFLFCQLFFTIGFFVFAGKPISKRKIVYASFLKPDPLTLSTIKVFAVVVCFIIVLANLFLISQKGVALLADDPSAAKGENFQGGGFGFIRRINWGILYLCALFLIYMILYKRSIWYLLLSFLLIFILMLSGSKGVLIFFMSLVPMIAKFKDVKSLKTFKWMVISQYILFGAGFILAISIISATVKGSSEEAMFSLGKRFLFFGDAMLYYYNPFAIKHFAVYNYKDFIPYELNPILGFFRLVTYTQPLGFELVEFTTSIYEDTVFGPNVPYYVKGYIFFGKYGAFVYAFVIGGIFGWVRSLYYDLLEKPKSVLVALLVIFLNLSIPGLPQDSQLYINIMFDTFFQAVPIYLLIYFILKKGALQKEPALEMDNLQLKNLGIINATK